MAGGVNFTASVLATNHVVTAAEWAVTNSTAWNDIQAAWSGTYTPALTAVTTNPTLGSGSSVAGTWWRVGKTIKAEGDIVAGTSGTLVGSGAYQINLPTAAEANAVTLGKCVGYGFIFDSSGGRFFNFKLRCDSSTTARMIEDGGGTFISDSSPAAFAGLHINDRVQYVLDYQGA